VYVLSFTPKRGMLGLLMPTFRTALLIRNPAAGVGWLRPPAKRVIRGLREWLPGLEVADTTAPGQGERLAREASRNGCDLILVWGGDGTIGEVLNGIVGTPTVLAVIPGGTGNSVAREIGLPLRPVEAVGALREGRVREVYLGKADENYFGLMIGVGFDADAVRRVPNRLKKILGRIGYFYAGVIALVRYRYPAFTLWVDQKPLTVTSAIIAKSKYYASRFCVAPHASLETPGFQVCAFAGRGAWAYLKFILAVMLRRHERLRDVTMMDGREIRIETVPGLSAHRDGEPLNDSPSVVRIADQTVRVMYPKSGTG
jgi:YegS/Rv2252/BmrU family lipid kinase